MSARDDFNAYQARARRSERTHVSRAKGHKPGKSKPHKPKKPSYLDDPSYVTRPLTLRDINRNADTSANLRYGGQEQALGLQARQIPAWFEQYKGQVQGIAQGIQTGYQQAIKDVGDRATQTQTANDTSRSQLLAQAQKDAASRGATVDPSVYLNDANAATVNRQGSNDFQNLLQAQQLAQVGSFAPGQAPGGYFGGIQAAAGAGQIAALQQNAADSRSLQGEKGLYKSDYVTQARGDEHKSRLEDAAFGLDQYKAQSTAATTRSRIRSTNRNAAAQRKQSSRTEKNTVITSGPFAGLTHQQVRDLTPAQKAARTKAAAKTKAQPKLSAEGLKAKRNIRSGVKQLRDHDNGTAGYWKGAFDELTSQNGIDPVVARAIVQGARLGRIGPKTAKTLREDYGIDPKSLRFNKPKKRRKPHVTPDNAHGY